MCTKLRLWTSLLRWVSGPSWRVWPYSLQETLPGQSIRELGQSLRVSKTRAEITRMSSANSKPVILVQEVTKVYPSGVIANDAVSLEIHDGEIVGILGPNGAGKTTLIRQILGLLKPTRGTIIVNVSDHTAARSRERHLIGYVPQMPLCYPSLTVWETIEFVLRLNGIRGKALITRANACLLYTSPSPRD